MNPRKAFELALVPGRVAARFAMEHATPEARKKYLQDHREADPSNHTVKPQSKGRDKADDDDGAEKETDEEKASRKELDQKRVKWKLEDIAISSRALSSRGEKNPLKPLLRAIYKKQDTKHLINPALALLKEKSKSGSPKAREHYLELHDWLRKHVKGK